MTKSLDEIATALFAGGTPHPDYDEDGVKCRDCKCRVRERTVHKAAGHEMNGEFLCSICVKDYNHN